MVGYRALCIERAGNARAPLRGQVPRTEHKPYAAAHTVSNLN
jgi:hypothetical protein